MAALRNGLRGRSGFTLLELMFTVAVGTLLIAIAVPTYSAVVDRQRTSRAIADLSRISLLIERYRTTHSFDAPMTLDELGEIPLDPWGNEYRYLNFAADIPGIQGLIRKDHNLHPLNSEFDLYSVGPDGESRAPLTARASRDDIVYGRDGGFIGPASEF
jgi:general secretion pathway protein G